MAESTLALSYDDIRKDVAELRGYRTTPGDWEEYEIEVIDKCLRIGSAMFYTQAGHEWSFLAPIATVILADGTSESDLPWDFGFPVDDMVYFASVGATMRLVNDGVILLKRQNETDATGRPVYGAIVSEGKPGFAIGQSSKLIFWPEADDDYTVNLRYSILPGALNAKTPMPYGGAAHANTVRLACMAASERQDGNPQGPCNLEYMAALEQSKIHDRRLKPRMIGGKKRYPDQHGRFRESNVVTYVPGP